MTAANLAETYDLVIIGSGVGGLSTALAAAEAGLSVVVLEKDVLLGGGTALSHGGLWAGCNHIGRELGIPDSRAAVLDYMRFVAGGAADDALLTTFVDAAPVALAFFARCGIGIRLLDNFPDHYYPVAPGSTAVGRSLEAAPVSIADLGEWGPLIRDSFVDPHRVSVSEFIPWGGVVNRKNRDHALVAEREAQQVRTCGAALIAHFLRALRRHDVPIALGAEVTGLLSDATGVSGVRTRDGRTFRARKAVVLATGGWEGDAELTHYFEGLPEWRSPFPKAVAGDGLRLATALGAATALVRNNLAVMVGFPVPPRNGAAESEFRLTQIFECQCPHTIIVNEQGARFSDESYFQDTIAALRAYDVWGRRYPNLPCFLVFDAQYIEDFAFCGAEPGTAPPDWVARGDTIEELAAKLGLAAAGLRVTIARFNGFARDGVDQDFHRGEKKWRQAKNEAILGGHTQNHALGSLEKPPFYGVRLYPSAFVPSGGIRTNQHGQVLDTEGAPIAKLYGIGNVAAHLEYGIGYQAGYSLTSAMTFGYLSVEHMKAQSAPQRVSER
jgi:3-oxosteroid 1-dehydrogenase